VARFYEVLSSYRSVFIVWLFLMILLVGFIIFFDRYGEVLVMRAWEEYPPNAYEVGMKYLDEGRPEKAARKLETALEFAARPGGREAAWKVRNAKLNLGKIYYELGQYDRALPFLKEIAENAPGLELGTPVFYLGEVYRKKGEKEEAANAFKLTTEWNFGPVSAVAFFRMSELDAEAGRYESAVGNLETAITLDAGEALTDEMWQRAATIAREAAGRAGGAAAALAHELLGISLYRLKGLDASVEELEAALKRGRNTQRVDYFLAKIYQAQGMHEKAQQHFAQLPRGKVVIEGKDMIHTFGYHTGDAWAVVRNGKLRHELFLADRIEKIEVVAKGTVANFVSARMVVLLAGERVGGVETTDKGFERYVFGTSVSKEHALLEIEFANDYRDPETGEDRNLYVQEIAIYYSS